MKIYIHQVLVRESIYTKYLYENLHTPSICMKIYIHQVFLRKFIYIKYLYENLYTPSICIKTSRFNHMYSHLFIYIHHQISSVCLRINRISLTLYQQKTPCAQIIVKNDFGVFGCWLSSQHPAFGVLNQNFAVR